MCFTAETIAMLRGGGLITNKATGLTLQQLATAITEPYTNMTKPGNKRKRKIFTACIRNTALWLYNSSVWNPEKRDLRTQQREEEVIYCKHLHHVVYRYVLLSFPVLEAGIYCMPLETAMFPFRVLVKNDYILCNNTRYIHK